MEAAEVKNTGLSEQEGLRTGVPWLKLAVLAVPIGFLYYEILIKLVGDWWKDPNFSHGFLVPIFSAVLVWQSRERLAALPANPSWVGLAIVAGALGILIVGQLGAEFFLSRSSLVFLLAGLVIYFLGWNSFRKVLFPWAFLFFMIPIPAIVFNQIAFPLQFLAARMASSLLVGLGVPVLREGNILQLPTVTLEVAQACSGIRSLMSLGALAVIYGYFLDSNNARRVILALASIPIAVAANGLRVMGTGLLGYYWDPDKAEGFFHTFSGWLIFIVSIVLLAMFHAALRWVWKWPQRGGVETDRPSRKGKSENGKVGRFSTFPSRFSHPLGWPRLVIIAVLLLAASLFLLSRGQAENLPPHEPLASFPLQVGAWQGREILIPQYALEVLGAGEFVERNFSRSPNEPPVDLFLAYFPSQRLGSTIHSPQNCLPGSGWTPLDATRTALVTPVSDRRGRSAFEATEPGKILVNRYILSKGLDKMLVLYWYQAHSRVIASEYWAKFFMVADSIRMNRSDGALVRVTTHLERDETVQSAEARSAAFLQDALPILDNYIPR